MLRVIRATWTKNQIVAKRAFPWSFIIGRILMGVYTSLFAFFTYHFMFNGQVNSEFFKYSYNSDYMTFSVLGSGIYILSVAIIMNVSRSLMLENWEGTLEPFLISPASRLGYFLGNLCEQLSRSILEFGTVLIIGLVLGANFSNISFLYFFFVLLISIFAFFCMGVFLCSVMLFFRDTYLTQNTLFISMSLLCGVTFPIQYLPSWMQIISNVIPLTWTLDLFRSVVINGDSIFEDMGKIIYLLVISILYLVVGLLWLKKEETKLLEKTFS